MSEKLLNCPFCGAEAEVMEDFYDCPRFWVRCENCAGTAYGPDPNDDEGEAIAAWNKRFVCLDRNGDKVFSDSRVEIVSQFSENGDKCVVDVAARFMGEFSHLFADTDYGPVDWIELINENKDVHSGPETGNDSEGTGAVAGDTAERDD